MTPMEELREQAAKIARRTGEAEAGGLRDASYKRGIQWATDRIVEALAATPLPAPVALPQAGEVACLLCELINENELLLKAAQTILDRGYVSEHIEEERADYLELKTAVEVASSSHASGNLMEVLPGSTPTAAAPDDDPEEAYQMGKREGYEEALADVDRRTGGDGEYFASTIPGRGCPDHQAMMAKIVERFEAAPDDGLMGRWMPIETAPKDGSWVLVCEHECEGIVPAYYAASMHSEGYWMANCGQHVTDTPAPTHWMPLPAPPATLSTATGDEAQQGEG